MARRKARRTPYAAGVVLASGAGTRVGAGMNKVYLPLAGRRLVSWSLGAFARVPEIGVLVLVTRPQDTELVEWVLDREVDGTEVELVHGGDTRQESELKALRHLASRIDEGTVDTVLLHDAARPLVSPSLIAGVLHAAREHGGAIPGLPADDIVAVGGDGSTLAKQPPGAIIRTQTPQGFRATPLLAAYEQAAREEFLGTDTASCMERFSGLPVRWVRGEQRNFKITYPHDLVIAEQVLAAEDYQG
ncbi:2-C-methyl-D-erythritol 4-phosphate cytidylyltransferase [Saccharomonospora amisosensis]|uniref:2-C-methyl-D-erythritol 4-phosphate cytidylyltransferase n=1 Tax=Saccharomonospora amisosensis TaxID=1128677 RepID=A0A7X5UTL3_9PSEU|nr:2-C-methyl-D-erythritol 4-phosphate cytidylyltransferase [Saccharomonospora amisosensis]NIJ13484.1 2-C-methyl-D-erythritol 4-phosphate cytidylyltransferase [Saccharomonospora amisosensis]